MTRVNALVLRDEPIIENHDNTYCCSVSFEGIAPNLKKNKAYYLYTKNGNRIFHITDHYVKNKVLNLVLGNSYIINNPPSLTIDTAFVYESINKFKMIQLQAGVLVNVEDLK